jgi:hypothetical protein
MIEFPSFKERAHVPCDNFVFGLIAQKCAHGLPYIFTSIAFLISRPNAPTSEASAAASSHRPWQTVEVSIAVTTKLHCDLAFNWVTILPHIYFDGRQRL